MAGSATFARFMLAPATASGALPVRRDIRVDVLRGLALLVIFITHMPGNVVAGFMPHSFGFSDAAEVFVLLAGVSAMLAYAGSFEQRGYAVGMARILGRMATLYIAHIFLFILVSAVVAVAVEWTENPLYIETINIQPFLNDTMTTLAKVVSLTYLPNFLDILPLYIVLLALFPVIHMGIRRSPALTLAVSALVWQVSVGLEINLPNAGAAVWFFNPFAWQFMFTLGAVIGQAMRLGLTTPRQPVLTILAIAIVAGSLAIKLFPGNPFGLTMLDEWVENLQLGTDKTNLALVRVVHLAALAWLFITFVPSYSRILASSAAKALATLGRHSLQIFCVATVLSVVGQVVMAETAFDIRVQLATCAAGGVILVAVGNLLTWYRTVSQRQPRDVAARESAPA